MRHNSALVIALAIFTNLGFAWATQDHQSSDLGQVDAKDQTPPILPNGPHQEDEQVSKILILAREVLEEHGPDMLDFMLNVTGDPILSNPAWLGKRDGEGLNLPLFKDQIRALDPPQKREIHKRVAELSAQAKAQIARLQATVDHAADTAKQVKAQKAADQAKAEQWLTNLKNVAWKQKAMKAIKVRADTAAMCARNYGTFDGTFGCLMMAVDRAKGNAQKTSRMCRTPEWLRANNGQCPEGFITPVTNGACCWITDSGDNSWGKLTAPNQGHEFHDPHAPHGGHDASTPQSRHPVNYPDSQSIGV